MGVSIIIYFFKFLCKSTVNYIKFTKRATMLTAIKTQFRLTKLTINRANNKTLILPIRKAISLSTVYSSI